MTLNSIMQQIPVLTSANLLAMGVGTTHPPPFDPLIEIRNGQKEFLITKKKNIIFNFSSTSKSCISMASFFS